MHLLFGDKKLLSAATPVDLIRSPRHWEYYASMLEGTMMELDPISANPFICDLSGSFFSDDDGYAGGAPHTRCFHDEPHRDIFSIVYDTRVWWRGI